MGGGRRRCQLPGAGARSEHTAAGKVGPRVSRPWGECVADRGPVAAGGATKDSEVGSYCRDATETRRRDGDCDTDDTRGAGRRENGDHFFQGQGTAHGGGRANSQRRTCRSHVSQTPAKLTGRGQLHKDRWLQERPLEVATSHVRPTYDDAGWCAARSPKIPMRTGHVE